MTVKGELQNPGTRQLKLVAQCLHIRSNNSQIFDDELQVAQLVSYCFKKMGARPWYPLSGLGRWCACWNMPCGREAAEVIQANRIHVSEQGSHSVNRPTVTRCPQGVPVVDGIAPQLALRTEIVRGNTGNESRPAMLVKQE